MNCRWICRSRDRVWLLATGLSVFDVYNSSTYVQPGHSHCDLSDFFFAGDIQNSQARLPGLRLRGSCQPDTSDAAMAVVANTTTLSAFCASSFSTIGDEKDNTSFTDWESVISYGYCTDLVYFSYAFDNNKSESIGNAFVFFDTTNTTSSTKGMVSCQSSLTLGTALLDGSQGTYQSFREEALYSNSNGGEPLLDPLGPCCITSARVPLNPSSRLLWRHN